MRHKMDELLEVNSEGHNHSQCIKSQNLLSSRRMQGPTHIMAGIIIQRTFTWRYFRGLAVFFTIISALLIHGIFDKMAKACYHPMHTDFTDPIWLIYHIVMWLTSLVMLYMYWGEYKIGILISMLPEIDWIVLGTADAFGKQVIFYKQPWIHDTINYFIDNVIPFSYLNLLPDNSQNPLAVVYEILLFALLILIFKLQINRRRNIHF